MFRGIIALSLTALAFVFSADTAWAAFQITIAPQQSTLQSGEIGQIDVYVSSDASDLLLATGFRFTITSNSSINPDKLTFLNLTDVQNSDLLSDSKYVFAGISAAAAFPFALGTVDTSINPQIFEGGDILDFSNPAFTGPITIGDTPLLLARLYVQAGPLISPDSSVTFRIGFDPDPSVSYLTPDLITFDNSAFNVSADVTVVRGNGASVTPVPPSLLLALSGAVTAGLASWVSGRWKTRRSLVG